MTDEQDGFDRDDDLRALLRSGDPAGSLSPADPAALASLLEDIMSADLDVRPDGRREAPTATGTHGRNRLTWLVAAAAAAVIAAAGGFAVSGLGGDDAAPPPRGRDDDRRPRPPEAGAAAGRPTTAPIAGVTTSSRAPSARVRGADPGAAGQYHQAFEGTVTAIDGDGGDAPGHRRLHR